METEVYEKTGFVFCRDGQQMLVREAGSKATQRILADHLPPDRKDPFINFANVTRGKLKLHEDDPSTPANNEIVMKILERSQRSAAQGRKIGWNAAIVEERQFCFFWQIGAEFAPGI